MAHGKSAQHERSRAECQRLNALLPFQADSFDRLSLAEFLSREADAADASPPKNVSGMFQNKSPLARFCRAVKVTVANFCSADALTAITPLGRPQKAVYTHCVSLVRIARQER